MASVSSLPASALRRVLRPQRALRERSVTSLPQIPGLIFTNKEIPQDRLISEVRRWVSKSELLSSSGTFDLLQIAESTDGRVAPRAVCGLLRTKLRLAEEGEEPLRAMVTLFYRARDFLNREFWEDQLRRLSDIAAEEYLAPFGRGVQLVVHHSAPSWAMGLEVGDHRLLAEVETMHVYGRRWRRVLDAEPELAKDGRDESLYHELLQSSTSIGEVTLGSNYVLRLPDGTAACGLRALGLQGRLRLVCGAAWALPGHEAALDQLADTLRKRVGTLGYSLVADIRDPCWTQLCGDKAITELGVWRRRKRTGVAITASPIGLTEAEQARLAKAPLLIPWEVLPFHAGRVMFI